jgi:NAD(P)-dependent dehydrogenase (short-subunit alcohol dehydrogenase family)
MWLFTVFPVCPHTIAFIKGRTCMTGIPAGKIALVTGGSRGIGAAIAIELASQGATVAISYSVSDAKAKEVVAKIEASGGSAIALKADQAVESEVVGLVSLQERARFRKIPRFDDADYRELLKDAQSM